MNFVTVFPIILFSLLGGIISNFFSHSINISRHLSLNRKVLFIYLMPFLVFFARFEIKKNIRIKLILSHILGVISFLILGFSLENLFKSVRDINYFEVLLVCILIIIILIYLLYLAIYDLYYYEIPTLYSKQLVFIVIIANIVIGIAKIINFELFQQISFDFITLGTPQNLLGFIAGYLITYLLVKFSNEKALGDGDIDLNALIGGVIGIKYLFIYFFVVLTLGTIFGITYAAMIKKIKDVLIPLVPILLLAFVICLGFSDNIYEIIFID